MSFAAVLVIALVGCPSECGKHGSVRNDEAASCTLPSRAVAVTRVTMPSCAQVSR